MVCRRQLDALGGSATAKAVIRNLFLASQGEQIKTLFCSFACLLLACWPTPVRAQADQAALAHLLQQEHWEELLHLVQTVPERSADLEYEYGVALAHLERWDEAHQALRMGLRLAPRDKRFSIELAGVAFKQKKYTAATSYLHRALRLDPHDAYANDFLATIYYLQGNVEAAVKYWNRVEEPGPKPQIAG